MTRYRKATGVWTLFFSLALPIAAAEVDDCGTDFLAAIGSSAYRFNPQLSGEPGLVRLFAVLSYEAAASRGEAGQAFWKLEIRPSGSERPVRVERGVAAFDLETGQALAEFWWNGRDDTGGQVPSGKYQFSFKARYLGDHVHPAKTARRYEDLRRQAEAAEAFASTSELIVDHGLSAQRARSLSASQALAVCPVQQNEPLEADFPYNFYYGSTHSHSKFSDGGLPTTAECRSGRPYGRGTLDPAAIFEYARVTAGLDYWVVNEHNHLINDADPNLTPAQVRQRYQDGLAAAEDATKPGSFVALYGMEWGVTSDYHGHVTLLETPVLFGWEPVGCTSDCYWDVFTPRSGDYLGLYARSVANPPPMTGTAAGILCHPRFTHFDRFAYNADADRALQGIAVRSGLAFTRRTDCNVVTAGAFDYSPVWLSALDKGFHLGPVADHDSHCENFGVAIPNRTVYLLPIAKKGPTLTKEALLAAHSARHFFATEDPNAQLVFTATGERIMGDIFSVEVGTRITLRGAVYDREGQIPETIEVWRGEPGGGVPVAPYASRENQSEIQITENPSAGTYYYFIHAVLSDPVRPKHLWSAPIWITFTCTDDDTPRVTIVSPPNSSKVSGNVTIQVAATDATCGVRTAEVSISGGRWLPASFNSGTGFYEHVWNSAATCGGPATIDARATDRSDPPHTGSAPRVNVTVVDVDTAPPVVAILTPQPGTRIVCTDTDIEISASDPSGIALVEVRINDGSWEEAALDPDSGNYEYTWASGSAPPGNYTISARATDATCSANVGTATPVPVTVEGGNCVGGWRLVQANSSLTYTFPTGTRIPDNGYLVIGRNATRAEFEAYWRTTLEANVVYVNGSTRFPQINGQETYTLYDQNWILVDGTTIPMRNPGVRAWTIQRLGPCTDPGDPKSWLETYGEPLDLATPGRGAVNPCGGGVVINEFSDTLGGGTFHYEFIELYADNE